MLSVLKIDKAPEPEAIRYGSVGLVSADQSVMQKIVMVLIVFVFFVVEFLAVRALEAVSPAASGLVITVSNTLVPELLHVASDVFEVHELEGQKIGSVYNKVSMFRYFNTAIIIHLLTDFSVQLSPEHLLKVQIILVCDALLTPLLYLFNASWIFNRVVLSRYITEEAQLRYALGGEDIRLSDRYSNLAKCIFVGLVSKMGD